MGEDLKQHGGNAELEKPVSFEAKLSKKGHIYNLRNVAYLGEADSIKVELDPFQPSLFAVLDKKIEDASSIVAILDKIEAP